MEYLLVTVAILGVGNLRVIGGCMLVYEARRVCKEGVQGGCARRVCKEGVQGLSSWLLYIVSKEVRCNGFVTMNMLSFYW